MSREVFPKKREEDLIYFAKRMLTGSIDFVEGVRRIHDLIDDAYADEDDLMLFLSVDSQTDDVPVGEARKMWNRESLQELDMKLSPYLEKVRPKVLEACKRIIKTLEEK